MEYNNETLQGFSQHNIAFGRLSPPHEEPRVGGLEIFDGEWNRPGGMAAKSHLYRRQGVRPRRRRLIREADSQQSDTILPQVPSFDSLNCPFIEFPNPYPHINLFMFQGRPKRARQHSPTLARCLSRGSRNHER